MFPPAAGPTGPASPETETLWSGAFCWPAAAGGSEKPPGPHDRGPCLRTRQPGEGQMPLKQWWGDDYEVGLRRSRRGEKVDESWIRR